MRHECKFPLTAADAAVLRTRLPLLLPYDPYHIDTCGRYEITSLYFDTPNEKALREKESGIAQREKYRLRRYGQDTDNILLERKYKSGDLVGKEAAALSREQCERLLQGDTAWMIESREPFIRAFYMKWRLQCLRPRSLVVYQREAYAMENGGIRVTLDSDIRTGVRCTDFLAEAPALVPVRSGFCLLEVKYGRFLPQTIRGMIQCGSRMESFSKFEAAHIYD